MRPDNIELSRLRGIAADLDEEQDVSELEAIGQELYAIADAIAEYIDEQNEEDDE